MVGKKLVNAKVIRNANGEIYIDDLPIFTHKGVVIDEKESVCDFETWDTHGKIGIH